MMTLSATDDVAIPELEMADAVEEQPVAVKEEVHEEQPVAAFHPNLVGQRWTWSYTATEMAHEVGDEPWCPMPSRSPERESSPRGRWCRRRQPSRGRRATSERCRRTPTSLAMMTTTAASEDGDGHGSNAGQRILCVF
ncbi:hypothetical protein D1007_02200 [Hordeum vulgare]|nr:hypothetical protein D1007_02200 [Hordeum vulgare]